MESIRIPQTKKRSHPPVNTGSSKSSSFTLLNKTFADIPAEFAQYDSAQVILLPVPYDGTSTYGKGADKGPDALLDAATNVELYDIETDSEVYQKGIYLAPAVTEDRSPEQMVEAVEKEVTHYID